MDQDRPARKLPALNARRQAGARMWVLGAVAVTISTLIALAVCEVALRLVWPNPYRSEGNAQYLRLRIQPAGVDFLVDRSTIDPKMQPVRFRTNKRSYILPVGQHEQPQVTVAFLGGSTTECMAVDEPLRFPALVSSLLAERGLMVNTLNAGVSGNTLQDSLNILVNHVVEDHPDYVMVMNVANDVGVLDAEGDYRSRLAVPLGWSQFSEVAKSELSRRSALMGLLRKAMSGIKIEVNDSRRLEWRNDPGRAEKITADQYRARLRAFVGAAQGLGIRPILMTEPLSGARNSMTPDWADMGAQDRFNAIVRQVGAETHTPVFDLAQHLQDHVPHWDEPGKVFYDGMHVHDAGSRVYATFIADQLATLIRPTERAASSALWQNRSSLEDQAIW